MSRRGTNGSNSRIQSIFTKVNAKKIHYRLSELKLHGHIRKKLFVGGNMKKPDPKYCMEYVCKTCKKPMPVDEEKSTPEVTYLLDVCPCGGKGHMTLKG